MNFKPFNKLYWRKLGQRGEDYAAQYLEDVGYRIWHRNWRCRIGELDIIAIDGDTLVFVEVRTRIYRKESEIRARDSIGDDKQRKLISLIEYFLRAHETLIEAHRFNSIRRDVLGVEYRPDKKVVVDHIEDAF